MKLAALILVVGTGVSSHASAAESISVDGIQELRQYWIYDHAASLPLAKAAGMDLIVPPEAAKKAGAWKKVFSVSIDGNGHVTSAVCTDCVEGDPVAPVLAKGFLLERYKPAPGNTKRTPVNALLAAELLQPEG